jgi:hypothetical protein
LSQKLGDHSIIPLHKSSVIQTGATQLVLGDFGHAGPFRQRSEPPEDPSQHAGEHDDRDRAAHAPPENNHKGSAARTVRGGGKRHAGAEQEPKLPAHQSQAEDEKGAKPAAAAKKGTTATPQPTNKNSTISLPTFGRRSSQRSHNALHRSSSPRWRHCAN